MTKEVSMSFRVDTALRDQFSAAAEAERRPASQVLRDLMHRYIEQTRQRRDTSPRLSAWDQNRRKARLRSALASVELEGYDVPDAFKREAECFIDGTITLDALMTANNDVAG